MKQYLADNVFDAALDRLRAMYEKDRVVVSFSGGKDSGVILELAIIVAEEQGLLPIDVVMRDEEIMFPGTFEYCERVYDRKEVNFHWVIANQPIINIFNREMPYFWVFDPLLKPEQWVRIPPDYAEYIKELSITAIVNKERFPTEDGQKLVRLTGIRVDESLMRRRAIHSSQGYITKHEHDGSYIGRPIYDWKDGDVWKAVEDNEWDYNDIYDVMHRLGVSKHELRLAPPTMHVSSIKLLAKVSKAYPEWFNKVCERLPGVRSAAYFGKKAVEPQRHLHETWEQAFYRLCIDEAPAWIAERSTRVIKEALRRHARHSTTNPFPDVKPCTTCGNQYGSWKLMTKIMYNGDAFSQKQPYLKDQVEPEYFRQGAGTWGGKATW